MYHITGFELHHILIILISETLVAALFGLHVEAHRVDLSDPIGQIDLKIFIICCNLLRQHIILASLLNSSPGLHHRVMVT